MNRNPVSTPKLRVLAWAMAAALICGCGAQTDGGGAQNPNRWVPDGRWIRGCDGRMHDRLDSVARAETEALRLDGFKVHAARDEGKPEPRLPRRGSQLGAHVAADAAHS